MSQEDRGHWAEGNLVPSVNVLDVRHQREPGAEESLRVRVALLGVREVEPTAR